MTTSNRPESHTAARKVLVVDDSSTARQRVREALAPHGYEILEASDGLRGLELIRAHVDLALVICDVNMPRMGGLEMLAALRADDLRPTLSVAMLTAEGSVRLIEQARALGVKGWIVKPFVAEKIVSAVATLVADVDARRSAVRVPTHPAPHVGRASRRVTEG